MLGVVEDDGRVLVDGQRSIKEPRLWLAGYGDWCGPGSATLMGAARTARDLAGMLGNVALVKRSEEHTSELQSLMRISYAVFCLKKNTYHRQHTAECQNQQQ